MAPAFREWSASKHDTVGPAAARLSPGRVEQEVMSLLWDTLTLRGLEAVERRSLQFRKAGLDIQIPGSSEITWWVICPLERGRRIRGRRETIY